MLEIQLCKNNFRLKRKAQSHNMAYNLDTNIAMISLDLRYARYVAAMKF